jgi:hypothetical protein
MDKNAKKIECDICDFITSNKSNFNKHLLTAKHLNRTMLCENNAEKFTCEYCHFECRKKSNYDVHLTTTKHKNRTLLNKKQEENAGKIFTCKKCNKSYNVRNSLWYHEKKCTLNDINLDEKEEDKLTPTQNIIISNATTTTNDIHQLTSLVIEVVKNNSEFQKQMFEMCKNMQSSIVSNCNNINTTNNFNLQVFLNEYCKDAMNISEFVDSFDLELSDLENVGRVGYIEGISNIIINKIKDMEVNKRPIHCSDLKREIVYIKDDDVWEREDANNSKFRKVIKKVAGKNIGMLTDWQDKYPECMDIESDYNNIYMKLMQSALGPSDTEGTEVKIMKKVLKHIVIDKKMIQ